MKHPATRELFDYWNDLRGERAAPERSEIDPSAIRDVLADTFMLEVNLEQRFPFRLAGTRVNGLFESEQKGRSFLDLWRGSEMRNIAAILMTVADGACPIVAGGVATSDGRDECGLELLLLPLRHNARTHSRILGLVTLTKKPAWVGLLPIGPVALRSLRIIDAEDQEAQSSVEQIAVGQSVGLVRPDQPAFSAETRTSPPKPHLRLIQGGRPER